MYPKVIIEKKLWDEKLLLLIPDNGNAFWLAVLFTDECERKGRFARNSDYLDRPVLLRKLILQTKHTC